FAATLPDRYAACSPHGSAKSKRSAKYGSPKSSQRRLAKVRFSPNGAPTLRSLICFPQRRNSAAAAHSVSGQGYTLCVIAYTLCVAIPAREGFGVSPDHSSRFVDVAQMAHFWGF